MTDDETPQQREKRQELLREFDRNIDQTLQLINRYPDRYLPPYAGQKPREFPAPERITSPERQDPAMPSREKEPPPIKDVPEPEKDAQPKALVFNSPEWRRAQEIEMAKKGVSRDAAIAQTLGLLGHAQPPSAAVQRKPGQARTGQDRDDRTPGQERSREQ